MIKGPERFHTDRAFCFCGLVSETIGWVWILSKYLTVGHFGPKRGELEQNDRCLRSDNNHAGNYFCNRRAAANKNSPNRSTDGCSCPTFLSAFTV
jgi:hypothetical protein